MGVKDNEFVFNGVSSKDFNIICSGVDSYISPLRRYEGIEIQGKNGMELRDKKSYPNAPLGYQCMIYNHGDDFERFKAFLLSQVGYNRLEDNFHSDEFRIAAVADEIKPKIKGNNYECFIFDVTFSCKPERFLKDGEKVQHITTSGILVNNTYFDAKPMIRVYESGIVSINGKTLTFSNIDGYMDIDCENMDCYKGSTNMNRYVSGDFPTLNKGINNISCTGTIDITPRWYTI